MSTRAPLGLCLLALVVWFFGAARAADPSPALAFATDADAQSGPGSTDTQVAAIHIHGNLRASAFLMSDQHLRIGGLRRLHLNPRVPSVGVEVRDASGRVLSSGESPAFLRGTEQWIEIPLQPGMGPLIITLSR